MQAFVFEYHEGGWESMRALLFIGGPSGADLMTRDLKMHMLGKERWWEGGVERRGAGGGEALGRVTRSKMDKNCREIKKRSERCKRGLMNRIPASSLRRVLR